MYANAAAVVAVAGQTCSKISRCSLVRCAAEAVPSGTVAAAVVLGTELIAVVAAYGLPT